MADHVYSTSGILSKASIDRKAIEAQIESLITMLDEMDGDPDIEENGDEHDTGMAEGWRGAATYSAFGVCLPVPLDNQGPILEDDEEGADAEPDEDGEPDLGWTLAGEHGDQWANNNGCELDDSDREPSLGWSIPDGLRVEEISGYDGSGDVEEPLNTFNGSGGLIAKQMLGSIGRAAQ